MKKFALGVIGVVALAFLWWVFSPLLFDVEVQDELDPTIAALLETPNEPVPILQERSTPAATQSIAEESDQPLPTPAAITSGPAPEVIEEVATQPAPGVTPGPVVRGPFPIMDTPGHDASGSVRVIETPDNGSTIRFENYDGTNGPDLEVYLAKDLEATEFVSLGAARGNQGNLNYTVPDNIDIDEYQYVMTWCKAFGVLFDYAQIN